MSSDGLWENRLGQETVHGAHQLCHDVHQLRPDPFDPERSERFTQDQEQPGPYGGSDLTHKPAKNICRAVFRPVALQLARVPENDKQGQQHPRTSLGDGRSNSALGIFSGLP